MEKVFPGAHLQEKGGGKKEEAPSEKASPVENVRTNRPLSCSEPMSPTKAKGLMDEQVDHVKPADASDEPEEPASEPPSHTDRPQENEALRMAEREGGEQEFQKVKERFDFVLKVADLGYWNLDLEDHTAFRSLRHDQIFGYDAPVPEWTYEMFLEHVLPEGRPAVQAAFDHALQNGEDWDFECRIRRADGAVRWIWGRGRVWEKKSGEPHRMLGTITDITERKQREEALRETNEAHERSLKRERAVRAEAEASEERMAFLAEAGAVLASSLDYEATLQQVAALAVPRLADWCAITMFAPEEASKEAPGEAFQQVAVAHRDPEKVAWARALRERYPPDPEAPNGAPNVIRTGKPEFYPEIQEEILAAAARNDEHLELMREVGFRSVIIVPMKVRGEAIGAITLVWSESEKYYTASDLRLAEELARRAALEINDARLYEKMKTLYREAEEARREAEEMNRLKSAFLANMSHEIRTPLTGMIGFASLLTKRLSDQERGFAQRIVAGGQRLMDTLNAVLALSRLEAGQGTLQLEALRVAEEARQGLVLLEKQAHQNGLALTLDVAPDAEEAGAYLDRGAFSSILNNLVGNAIKFTDQGKIMVTIEKDMERIYLRVKDTGIGIDEAFLPHLFEPFQQESKGWSRSHEGTGLGLPIAKQLVEIMEGEIDVKSEKGSGSRFTVSFPAASVDGEKRAPSARSVGGVSHEVRPQLLVVEDNEDTRFLLEMLLDDLGEVKTAASAEDALEEARSRSRIGGEAEENDRPRPFDLCLVDINLGPGKSGTDLLQELRTVPPYREVPFVAITGYALPGDREQLLGMGFDDYLAKPFDPGELLELSTQMLRQ